MRHVLVRVGERETSLPQRDRPRAPRLKWGHETQWLLKPLTLMILDYKGYSCTSTMPRIMHSFVIGPNNRMLRWVFEVDESYPGNILMEVFISSL